MIDDNVNKLLNLAVECGVEPGRTYTVKADQPVLSADDNKVKAEAHINDSHEQPVDKPRHYEENLSEWDVEHLIAWIKDGCKKPAMTAFTASGKRQVAYAIEELLTKRESVYDSDLNGEAIGIARRMLKEELGIQTAFFDDAVRNAIIFVNVLAKGFKTLDVGGENMIIPEVVEAREALKLIKSNKSEDAGRK